MLCSRLQKVGTRCFSFSFWVGVGGTVMLQLSGFYCSSNPTSSVPCFLTTFSSDASANCNICYTQQNPSQLTLSLSLVLSLSPPSPSIGLSASLSLSHLSISISIAISRSIYLSLSLSLYLHLSICSYMERLLHTNT